MITKNIKVLNESKKITLIFVVLIVGGIFVRLFFTPFSNPVSLDAGSYFLYAFIISEFGEFSSKYLYINYGWPTFLSIFFSLADSTVMLELMNMQRNVGTIISVLTVFPVYKLCRIFFEKNVALLGSTLFVFEPHLVANSFNGNTEPLFILLITLTLVFTFLRNSRYLILACICGGLAASVRYEGLLLIIPIIFTIILKNSISRKSVSNITIGISVFFIIVILFSLIGYNEDESLTIFRHIEASGSFVTEKLNSDDMISEGDKFYQINTEDRLFIFITDAFIGYFKFLVITLVPIILPFLILAILYAKKIITKTRLCLLAFIITLSMAGLYAYGRGIEDIRYILPLIPIGILISCVFFNKIFQKNHSTKILVFLGIGVIISSFLYVDLQKENHVEEFEIYQSALFVAKNVEGVNQDPGGRFLKIAGLEVNWPALPPISEQGKMNFYTKRIPMDDAIDLESYLINSKDFGLTHVVVHEKNNVGFLDEVFWNEEKFSYLEKVYDSQNLGHTKKIKIFKINYEQFKKL